MRRRWPLVALSAAIILINHTYAQVPGGNPGGGRRSRVQVVHDEGSVCIGASPNNDDHVCLSRTASGGLDVTARAGVTINGEALDAADRCACDNSAPQLNAALSCNGLDAAGALSSCNDVVCDGATSGVYRINPSGDGDGGGGAGKDVWCDLERSSPRGPWTTVLRRLPVGDGGRTSWLRSLEEYRAGFGNAAAGEFWAGLDLLAALSALEGGLAARLELVSSNGFKAVQEVGSFHVGNASTGWELSVSDVIIPTGDGATASLTSLDGRVFSAPSTTDDGEGSATDCATESGRGWWFDATCDGGLDVMAEQPTDDTFAYPIEVALLSVRPIESRGARSCNEILQAHPGASSGVYTIRPRQRAFKVWCDMDVSKGGGGWMAVQRRFDGSVSFNEHWEAYSAGFGNVEGEHWLGLRNVHELSAALGNLAFRVEEGMSDGRARVQTYESFSVAGEAENYAMQVSAVLSDPQFASMLVHSTLQFSTPDRDNDANPGANCADTYSAGWWFDNCWPGGMAPNNPWGDYPTPDSSIGQWQYISDHRWPAGASGGNNDGFMGIAFMSLLVREHELQIHGRSCKTILAADPTAPSGAYRIDPHGFGTDFIEVYCDMEVDGGGWVVFQRRLDGSVNFQRTYATYAAGFGRLLTGGEGWLGNDNLAAISGALGNLQLRIFESTADASATKTVLFDTFGVGGPASKYQLTCRNPTFTPDLGDNDVSLALADGAGFSAMDADNDAHDGSCSTDHGSAGWWFAACWHVNLNNPWMPPTGDGDYAGGWSYISDAFFPPNSNAASGATTFAKASMMLRE